MSSTLLFAERSMCCTVARLGCLLHAYVCFTYCVSISSIVPKYLMQTAGLLHLDSLLNPFLVPPVWPLLHFLPARPHKYYPCTTNSIMRAVKRGKPTALSVFITLGRPGCKWKEIRGLLFLLMGRGRAGLAS